MTVRIKIKSPAHGARVWAKMPEVMEHYRRTALVETVVAGQEDSRRRGQAVKDTARFRDSFVPVEGDGRSDAGNRAPGSGVGPAFVRRRLKNVDLRKGASIVNRARRPGQRRSYSFAPFGGRRRARNGRMIGSKRHPRPMGPGIQRYIRSQAGAIGAKAGKAAERMARRRLR